MARLGWIPVTSFFVLGTTPTANAQHASDNPVVSAEDAFGLTLGKESIGLYDASNIRGFSPQTAGNVRIEGLYFDQQGSFSGRVIAGSRIRVGLGAIDYPFPAPTGIVDYSLQNADANAPRATVIASAGPHETRGISIDGTLPLIPDQFEVPIGAGYSIHADQPGYTERIASLGVAPQWRRDDHFKVRAFFDWEQTRDSRTIPYVFTQGDYMPSRAADYFGQRWAEDERLTKNYGGMLEGTLTERWSLAAGLFRSTNDSPVSYADLYTNTQRSGLAEHVIVANPDQRAASTSGEARLTGQFSEGPRQHDIIVSARGRDVHVLYGGSDVVDLGSVLISQAGQVEKPMFHYSARTRDQSSLWSAGFSYYGSWPRHGEWTLGVQREMYKKSVTATGEPQIRASDVPWRASGAVAVAAGDRTTVYTSYTQGLEDSGGAPDSARNRGTIRATSRTWQIDAGVRYRLSAHMTLLAGVFQLDKPYFNVDVNNVDRELGAQRARGSEISIAGETLEDLHLNVGAVLQRVKVTAPGLSTQGIGGTAFGLPGRLVQAIADYRLRNTRAVSIDFGIQHWGPAPASTDGTLAIPSYTTLNFGARYRFTVARAAATLRLQAQGVANNSVWYVGRNPGFYRFSGRALVAYITCDI